MVACMGLLRSPSPTKMADAGPRKASLYPGLSTVDVTFGDLAAAGNPVEQFKLIPTLGLAVRVAGMIETYGEFQKPPLFERRRDRAEHVDLGPGGAVDPRRAHHGHARGRCGAAKRSGARERPARR